MLKVGRVYKIVSGQGNECYVGSTFNELKYRFRGHKDKFNSKNETCSVEAMFDKYGVENCKMILIKEYQVIDRKHLSVYETLWIKKLKAINKLEPCGGLLVKEKKRLYAIKYWLENKEEIAEKRKPYQKEYYEENKEQIKEKRPEWWKNWYANNRDRVSENNKKRYESRSAIITCECGSKIKMSSVSSHIKTRKHQAFEASQ